MEDTVISSAQTAVEALSDAEFAEFQTWIEWHARERMAKPFVVERENEMVSEWYGSNPPDLDETTLFPIWVQPTGSHDAWPIGAYVIHNMVIWMNTSGVTNVWEPGNDGPVPTWSNVTFQFFPDGIPAPGDDTDPVDPVDPEGPDDYVIGHAYSVGDLLTYEGLVYKVLTAHTSAAHWPPPDSPALYQSVPA